MHDEFPVGDECISHHRSKLDKKKDSKLAPLGFEPRTSRGSGHPQLFSSEARHPTSATTTRPRSLWISIVENHPTNVTHQPQAPCQLVPCSTNHCFVVCTAHHSPAFQCRHPTRLFIPFQIRQMQPLFPEVCYPLENPDIMFQPLC